MKYSAIAAASTALVMLALSGYSLPSDLEYKDDDPSNPAGDPPANEKKENAADTDNQETKRMVERFMGTWDAFQKKHQEEMEEVKSRGKSDPLLAEAMRKQNDEMDELKKMVDGLRLERARPVITDMSGKSVELTDEQIEHKKAFSDYFMSGDESGLSEMKAISLGSDPDGGYLAPIETENSIDRVLTETSPMRGIATVRQTGASIYRKPVNLGGAGSGWVGERGGRPETKTPELAILQFGMMELYAMPAATQTILEDASQNIDSWLSEEVNITFAEQEGKAYISGNGVDRPKGVLSYKTVDNSSWKWGSLGRIKTGVNGAFAADVGAHDNLVDLIYGTKSAYRSNGRFIMNRLTQGEVRKIKDADGNPMWQPGLQSGQPSALMGYPISEMDDMDDMATGKHPIAFGDFRKGYLILDRRGVRILRDPYSNKPYVLFYTTKRVGGGVQDFDAIKLLQTSA